MRISLDRVRFSNILLFGNRVQEVELLPGFNVIVGRFPGKTSSNRAGKTSFTDVISFALYGRVLKSLTQAQLINWSNRKNCRTEIDFTKGTEKYTIIRGLKPNIIEVYHNGVLVPFVGARDIQRQIEDDILGISYNTFTNLVYTNINFSVPILKMKSMQKRSFMESLFNLEFFSKLNARSASKLGAIEKKINLLRNQIKVNQAVVGEHLKHIGELKSGLNVNDDLAKRLRRVEREITESINIDEVNIKLDKARVLHNKYKDIHRALGAKIEICKMKEQSLMDESTEAKNIKAELLATQKEIKLLNKSLNKEKTLPEIDEEIESCRKRAQELQDIMDKEHYEAVSLSSLGNAKRKELDTLRNDASCPTCRRAIDDYMVYTILENEIDDYFKKHQEHTNKLAAARKEKEEISYKKTGLQDKRKDVTDSILRLGVLNKQLATLETFRSQRTEDTTTRAARYRKANKRLTKIYKEYCEKIDQYDKIIVKLEGMVQSYNNNKTLMEEKQKLQYQIEYNDQHRDNAKLKIKELANEDVVLEKQNKEHETEIERLNKLYDYLALIKDVCKDENAKQYAISSIIPYLTRKTNEYLAAIDYQFYVELDKWAECTIRGPGINNGSYDSLSGGESRSVDIAMMMAFNDVSRISSPNYFDMMILDELLDSSVDSSSIGSVVNIIRTKQAADNLKLFMITHRPEISDIEFDNVYTVERTGGFSRVEVMR